MSAFMKATPQQAAVKMSMYGPPGSGKTFSALLFAEGIAKKIGKRIAFVDTERGTDFYAMAVKERDPHPEAFDFDALYSRSIMDVLKSVRGIDQKQHGIVILDSVSHLWDAAIASYTGPKTKAGTIPMHAWGRIKAPYKDLMKFLIDSPLHVFILGRQANIFEEDADTGETKAAGFKMRAEGETAYEPHVCLRMTSQRTEKKGNKTVLARDQIITAIVEKDRSGILGGKWIQWPDFENVIAPLLGIMSGTQGHTPSEDDAANRDGEEAARYNAERERKENGQPPDPHAADKAAWTAKMFGEKPDIQLLNTEVMHQVKETPDHDLRMWKWKETQRYAKEEKKAVFDEQQKRFVDMVEAAHGGITF